MCTEFARLYQQVAPKVIRKPPVTQPQGGAMEPPLSRVLCYEIVCVASYAYTHRVATERAMVHDSHATLRGRKHNQQQQSCC